MAKVSMETTLGELVSADWRTADIFEGYGLDFCCGGQATLKAACEERGLDPQIVVTALEALAATPPARDHDYAAWKPAFLADYIVNVHHAWLVAHNDGIRAHTAKIAAVHGPRHPELVEVARIFGEVVDAMALHLREEEEVLFPAIRRLGAAAASGEAAPGLAGDRARIAEALATLGRDHEEIGAAVHELRDLTGSYAVPADGCATYALAYRGLADFEAELHKHVHLENNLLFPKAAGL